MYSTFATVPTEVRNAQRDHVLSRTPSAPVLLPLHVVLVLWKRLILLPKQLENIRTESARVFDATGRSVVLHLLNNNPLKRSEVDDIVAMHCTVSGCASPMEMVS